MKALGAELARLVDSTEASLIKITEADSRLPLHADGWSRKQVIGHLIDSASNNHQRFVRAALQGSLEFPGYDQAGCVRVQAVQEMPWPVLIALWASYNRYLAHVIEHLPEDALKASCRIGSSDPVTIQFLAEDYLVHLVHHLQQVR
ncbi:MAG: DinB family protein [Bryobacteraceae bacterium]